MFDFSIGKVAILFVLCLVVLGPEKLPKLAAQLGRFAGQARAMARHFRSQLEQEIAAEELKKEFRQADEAINKIANTATSSVQSTPAGPVHVEPATEPPSTETVATTHDVAHAGPHANNVVPPVGHEQPVGIESYDPDFNYGGHSPPAAPATDANSVAPTDHKATSTASV
jgi:sec-independent protein translocase protein TatB